MMCPAPGGGDGRLHLAGFQLEPGEPVEHSLGVPKPALALEGHPVLEIRRVIQG
jgi:hypothetical protein